MRPGEELRCGEDRIMARATPFWTGDVVDRRRSRQKGRVVSGLILPPHSKSFDGLGESAPTTAFQRRD